MCLHVKCLSFAAIRRSSVLISIYVMYKSAHNTHFSMFALKLRGKGGTFPNNDRQYAMQPRIAILNHVYMIVIHQKMPLLLLTSQD